MITKIFFIHQRTFYIPTAVRAAEQPDEELHEMRQVHASPG